MKNYIAIVYGDRKPKQDAEAIASVFVDGAAKVVKYPSELTSVPLFIYLLDPKLTYLASGKDIPLLVDGDMKRFLPNVNNRSILMHVTAKNKLAVSRIKTFYQPKGTIKREIIGKASARAKLPSYRGKWIYLPDFGKYKSFIKKYSDRGFVFVTVSPEVSKVEYNPTKVTLLETGSNREVLWNAILACDAIVDNSKKPSLLYYLSGKEPLITADFDGSQVNLPEDLNKAAIRMANREYRARTRRIAQELTKYHPLGDKILTILKES